MTPPLHDSGNQQSAIGWRLIAMALLSLPLAMNTLIRSHAPALPDVPAHTLMANQCKPLTIPSDWKPHLRFADRDQHLAFVCEGVNLEIYSAWYSEQFMRKKLNEYGSDFVEEDSVVSSEVETVSGRPFQALRLEDRGQSALLWISYRAAGREFANPIAAQFWYSFNTMLTLRSTVSLAVAVRAQCAPDCGNARAAFEQFADGGGIP